MTCGDWVKMIQLPKQYIIHLSRIGVLSNVIYTIVNIMDTRVSNRICLEIFKLKSSRITSSLCIVSVLHIVDGVYPMYQSCLAYQEYVFTEIANTLWASTILTARLDMFPCCFLWKLLAWNIFPMVGRHDSTEPRQIKRDMMMFQIIPALKESWVMKVQHEYWYIGCLANTISCEAHLN